MKANVLHGIGALKYEEVDLPRLKHGEALIRVRAAGICGSDIARVFTTGTYHFPTIIGHEFSGEVVDVADRENIDWVGKRVGIFPLKPCFKCRYCRDGEYELCANYDYLGSRCDGGFAEYVAVPIWNLLEIPDSISFESAAMLEPASVAMHALMRSGIKLGDKIAVIGPGTIGMILCRMAQLAGASQTLLIGRSQSKLDFALNYGVPDVCNSKEQNVVDWVLDHTDEIGADIVIEGTGASESLTLALTLVKPSGTVVILGNPQGGVSLDKNIYWKILRKQLHLLGTWNSSFGNSNSDWIRVLNLLRTKKIELEPLITHRFPLSELSVGLNVMRSQQIYTNKVMIVNQ